MKTLSIPSVLIALAALILPACGSPSTPVASQPRDTNPTQAAIAITIGETQPDYRDITFDIHRQNNCGGNSEAEYTYEQSRSIAHTLEVGAEFEVNAKGEVKIAGTGVELGASVAAKMGQTYGSERSVSRSLKLKAQPGSWMEHRIKLVEVWQTGEAQVTVGGGTHRVPFSYRSDFALELAESRQLACPTASAQMVAPTGTPAPATPAPPPAASPGLPEGYTLYDDFSDPGAFGSRWWVNDEFGLCTFQVADGRLAFDCRNDSGENAGATLHSSLENPETTGVAALATVTATGGPFQFITMWRCADDGAQRDYYLEVDADAIVALEYYPQEGYRSVELGRVPAALGEEHLLQMDWSDGGIVFAVDGQPMTLHTAPNLTSCFAFREWAFPFWLWPDGHRVQGHLETVGVR